MHGKRGRSYLDYYAFQAKARGVGSVDQVREGAEAQAYLYGITKPWLQLSKPIVDLGCGHGSYLWWLRSCGAQQILGVESAPSQVMLCRAAGFDVQEMDAIDWLCAQESASQSNLVAIDFIEHISKDSLMDFLAESQRILSPGGRLIVRYPNGDSPFVGLNLYNDITHFWAYTTNTIETLAKMHGFTSVSFMDQGVDSVRDLRWLKVPLGRACKTLLQWAVTAATKERVSYWNSSIWACLTK